MLTWICQMLTCIFRFSNPKRKKSIEVDSRFQGFYLTLNSLREPSLQSQRQNKRFLRQNPVTFWSFFDQKMIQKTSEFLENSKGSISELREPILNSRKLRIPSFFEVSLSLTMWVHSAAMYWAICCQQSLNTRELLIMPPSRMAPGQIWRKSRKNKWHPRKFGFSKTGCH